MKYLENKDLFHWNKSIQKLDEEVWNKGKEKYDYMAQTNIRNIKQSAQYLDEVIDKEVEDLPDWIEDKLSKCANDIRDIHDYFKNK